MTCPLCAHTHSPSDVMALGRIGGTTAYRTADTAIHETREDAQRWLCEQRIAVAG